MLALTCWLRETPGGEASILFAHGEPLALIVAKLELPDGSGFGRFSIPALNDAEVFAALAYDRHAP
jgi:hypothetical protein